MSICNIKNIENDGGREQLLTTNTSGIKITEMLMEKRSAECTTTQDKNNFYTTLEENDFSKVKSKKKRRSAFFALVLFYLGLSAFFSYFLLCLFSCGGQSSFTSTFFSHLADFTCFNIYIIIYI